MADPLDIARAAWPGEWTRHASPGTHEALVLELELPDPFTDQPGPRVVRVDAEEDGGWWVSVRVGGELADIIYDADLAEALCLARTIAVCELAPVPRALGGDGVIMPTYLYRVRPEHRSGRGTYWRPNAAGYTDDIAQAGRYDSPDGVRGSETAEAVLLSDELARIGALGEIGTLVHAEHPHVFYSDSDLVRRAAASAHRGHGRATRRGHIMEAFGVGSGVADTICRACRMDPDEVVGEDDEADLDTDGEE